MMCPTTTEAILRAMTVLVLVDVSLSVKIDYQHRNLVGKPEKYPLQVHSMYRDRMLKRTPKIVGVWSPWSPWTACSRSCGGGVTQQTRHCSSRPADSRFIRRQRRRRQASGCVGLYKRIHLCNSQECPNGRDFRYDQCGAFNNYLFRGNFHFWEPYFLAGDECALNCRPRGLAFYATLNRTVVDGTSCKHPVTAAGKMAPHGTRGVCIDGYCKSVNSNGIIGSVDDNQEDCYACLKGTCRSINGFYMMPNLPSGYSLVAQIPQGACKILVQQLKHTRNLLALRNANGSFIINGDWKFSNSRIADGAGTKFTYVKQDASTLETISAPGPLLHPVDIMMINYQTNLGIKYGYSLPADQEQPQIAPPLLKRPLDFGLEARRLEAPAGGSQRDEAARPPSHRRGRVRRRFAWKISGVSACSRSCGGGVQATVVTCIREHTQTPVLDRRCAHLERPVTQPIRCNVKDCPPRWESRWGPCSATCGDGIQHLIPQCQQEVGTGRSVIINEALCPRPKPPAQTRSCRLESCESDNELAQTPLEGAGRGWQVGPWSGCSASCGTGHRSRSVACPSGECRPEDRPRHAEYCDSSGPCVGGEEASPWLVTAWTDCSASCGTGTQTRLAICAQSTNCSDSSRPEGSRACSSDKQCGGQWFTGPWSSCPDSCTGPSKQTRQVFCIIKIRGQSHITNDMTCPMALKPELEKICKGHCSSFHWFTGEWGVCENCPDGAHRREVKCMDIYGRPFDGCPEDDMPIAKRPCTCKREEQKYKPAQDEPADRSCTDRIKNCYLAVQARLCQYPYYINHCCVSCKRTQQDLLE